MLEDFFNAKHSLQSIIDNYDGDKKVELVKIAQDKIDAILKLENKEEVIEKEDVEIGFENINLKDARLFENEELIIEKIIINDNETDIEINNIKNNEEENK